MVKGNTITKKVTTPPIVCHFTPSRPVYCGTLPLSAFPKHDPKPSGSVQNPQEWTRVGANRFLAASKTGSKKWPKPWNPGISSKILGGDPRKNRPKIPKFPRAYFPNFNCRLFPLIGKWPPEAGLDDKEFQSNEVRALDAYWNPASAEIFRR